MSNNLEHIVLKEELAMSETYGELYSDILDSQEGQPFNELFFEDLNQIYNAILIKYESLSDYQKDILVKLFDELNKIRIEIDPNRLKAFEHYYTEDEELILYRMSDGGITNIIINSDECFAFSYIPNDRHAVRELQFYDIDGDFEQLAYKFFTH